MRVPPALNTALAVLIGGGTALYCGFFVATTLIGIYQPWTGFKIDVLFVDFLVFHAAAAAYFEDKLAIIYNVVDLTRLQNTLYFNFIHLRLPTNLELAFRPFFNPPNGLLAFLPFALLPVGPSAIVFLLTTGTLCAIGLRVYGLSTSAVLAILAAPPAIWVIVAGQATYLSVGLFYGGLALLERRPVLAGVLLGLLAYKPTLWMLIPLALLVSRNWRSLLAMAVTMGIVLIVTLLLFGPNLWLDYIVSAQHHASPAGAANRYAHFWPMMETVAGAGLSLGLSDSVVVKTQFAAGILSAGAVIWAFTRRSLGPERIAILAAATFLSTPHVLTYDLLLLMPAVAMLFLNPAPGGYLRGERIVYALIWLLPLVSVKWKEAGWPVMPPAIILFGVFAALRLQLSSKLQRTTHLTTLKVESPHPEAAHSASIRSSA